MDEKARKKWEEKENWYEGTFLHYTFIYPEELGEIIGICEHFWYAEKSDKLRSAGSAFLAGYVTVETEKVTDDPLSPEEDPISPNDPLSPKDPIGW